MLCCLHNFYICISFLPYVLACTLRYARESKKQLDKAQVEWFKVVVGSFVSLVSLVAIGAIFFCVNEDWSVPDGIYWSFMTVTTIGYGDLKLEQGTSSKLFSVFYIIVSVSLIGASIGSVANAWLIVRHQQKEVDMLHRKLETQDFQSMIAAKEILPGGHNGLDSGEFLAYWLINEGIVNKRVCFHYLRSFYRLDLDGNKILNEEDLTRLWGRAYTRDTDRPAHRSPSRPTAPAKFAVDNTPAPPANANTQPVEYAAVDQAMQYNQPPKPELQYNQPPEPELASYTLPDYGQLSTQPSYPAAVGPQPSYGSQQQGYGQPYGGQYN